MGILSHACLLGHYMDIGMGRRGDGIGCFGDGLGEMTCICIYSYLMQSFNICVLYIALYSQVNKS